MNRTPLRSRARPNRNAAFSPPRAAVTAAGTRPILDSLDIVPLLACSMTRPLVEWTGALYDTSGTDVTKVWDQSPNEWHLVPYTHASNQEPTLTGSGNSARASYQVTSYWSALTTNRAGSDFTAGGNDLFLVLDPLESQDIQMVISRGWAVNEYIKMANGSTSAAVGGGWGAGNLRVNDAIVANTQDALWDAMNVSGLNVLSIEDCRIDLMAGSTVLVVGVADGANRLHGSFAEIIVTPPLSDSDHSAIVADIRGFYA